MRRATVLRNKNKRASQLCLSIEELQESFLIHRFNFQLYSENENQKIRLVKKFFDLKRTYDLIVLCFFIEKKITNNSNILLSQIVKYFHVTLEGCVALNASIQYLIRRHLIVVADSGFRDNEREYSLSQGCLTGILHYQRELITGTKTDSFEGFLKDFDALVSNLHDIPSGEVFDALLNIIDEFSMVREIKWLHQQNLSKINEVILCLAVREHLINGSTVDLEKTAKILGESRFQMVSMEREFMTGKSDLIKEEYLCFEADAFISKRLKLTQKSIDGFCSEFETVKRSFYPKMFSVINHQDIKDQHYLHENADLTMIENMTDPENYERIRLKVPRLTILLTGQPGVGKTAFLYHLAKKTGRAVLSANIAQILSCFVGESEKNLIQLFREAELAYQHYEVAPLIVFDEAESLLYQRHSKSGSAVEQMNNNVISLLLMSLDKFRGILICCSNFSFSNQGFDPALHRRFHMISEIVAPPGSTLLAIFNNNFPEFTDAEAVDFLDRYSFITPAQIVHLKEKYHVHQLFEDVSSPLGVLYRIAERDLELFTKKALGFCRN